MLGCLPHIFSVHTYIFLYICIVDSLFPYIFSMRFFQKYVILREKNRIKQLLYENDTIISTFLRSV